MPQIKLRKYQEEQENTILDAFKRGKKHLIMQLPTGGGKTILFTDIAKKANKKGKKVLILSNRVELMNQAGGAFQKFGIEPAFINPQVKTPSYSAMATSGMLQTLRRRIDKSEWADLIKQQDLIVIDEAHLADADYLFESGLLDDKYVLGATATPKRTGGQKQLGVMWDDIIKGVSVRELIKENFLVPERYFGVDAGDMSDVGYDYKSGDYKPADLYKKFNSKEKYTGVIDNYKTYANNTKTITFCVNRLHAVKTTVEFNKAGVLSMYLVSNTFKPKKPILGDFDVQEKYYAKLSKYEQDLEIYMYIEQYKYFTGNRKDLLIAYRKNRFLNIVNAGILTTGFDMPDIETVIINRSTLSLQLYLQMLGRASRISPETGKVMFTTLDFGGHATREVNNFGRYADDREWNLWHEISRGGGVPPTKECPSNKKDFRNNKGCGRLIPVSMAICPFCGYVFPTKVKEKEVKLKEIIYGNKDEELVNVSNMNYLQLKKYRELKKYHPMWIARVLNSRGGENEVKKGMAQMGYGNGFIWRCLNQLKKQKK